MNNQAEAKSNLLLHYLAHEGRGVVHSKFANGLNVQLQNDLIYIGSSGSSLSAFGLNITDKKLKDLLVAANIGDLVINKRGKLFFYGVQGVRSIAYQALEEVDLKLPAIACSKDQIVNSGLFRYLATMDLEQVIGLPLDDEISRQIDVLLQSDKEDMQVNCRSIRFFAGRGPGLTPSGDDLLLGFTLALLLFGEFVNWRKAMVAEIDSQATTMISVAYLQALLRGYVSEPFLRLAKLLDGAETAVIKKNVQAILSFGHTSGGDTLFGFFLGMKFLSI